jgi:hypothetical protein
VEEAVDWMQVRGLCSGGLCTPDVALWGVSGLVGEESILREDRDRIELNCRENEGVVRP